MQHFTAWQYLLIDCANQFGLDKELFESRILWAETHLHRLEELVDQADNKPLFLKTVMAIRDAQAGKPIGHATGFDACCSGMQIMSTLTGCVSGATATGLVDPNRRADAYTETTDTMASQMGNGFVIDRKDVKSAVMTSFYGSRATPKEIFGEDTPELEGFYKAINTIAPGAWGLLQDLLASWQPFALVHEWTLPDGYLARVKVMEMVESRLEVDELDHATFAYTYGENRGQESGLSNVANVVHSIDAYLLRSLIRRCNYDVEQTQYAMDCAFSRLIECDMYDVGPHPIEDAPEAIQKYVERFHATNMVDAVIIPHLNEDSVRFLTEDHLRRLNAMMEEMLDHKPFPILSVHDEFKCHPNNMNVLRQQYINLFAEMAESEILSDIFSQIHGVKGTYPKLTPDLGDKIRQSNYALS